MINDILIDNDFSVSNKKNKDLTLETINQTKKFKPFDSDFTINLSNKKIKKKVREEQYLFKSIIQPTLSDSNKNIFIFDSNHQETLNEQILSDTANDNITNFSDNNLDNILMQPSNNDELNEFETYSNDQSINTNDSYIESDESMNESNVENNNKEFDKSRLFQGSEIDVSQFLLTFYAIKAKHKLTDSASNDILKLIKIILPNNNNCPKTLNKFEKSFIKSNTAEYLEICHLCLHKTNIKSFEYFQNKPSVCSTCNIEFSTLVRFGIKSQLIEILQNEINFDQIRKNVQKARSKVSHEIETALDGSVYQEALKQIDQNKLIISLNLNCDGCPLIKSKNYCLWPLTATITELIQSTRESFQNIIILGIFNLLYFIRRLLKN
ncbi:unnamed protein product [Brachionus calyciflorus]|uniref:Uncharacterized protein n=1 Tax=Brachionus calyciflorus TaxID=104777 RepID=A0A814PLD1_9BILA|nr:unnamed protein product [Brachionus calyciflorus]